MAQNASRYSCDDAKIWYIFCYYRICSHNDMFSDGDTRKDAGSLSYVRSVTYNNMPLFRERLAADWLCRIIITMNMVRDKNPSCDHYIISNFNIVAGANMDIEFDRTTCANFDSGLKCLACRQITTHRFKSDIGLNECVVPDFNKFCSDKPNRLV